ncbi:MAG: dynamin family protein [Gammaproteobacteria bacterium]
MATDAQLDGPVARHVRATLVHVDRLLASALRHAGITLAGPFDSEYDDFTADEVFLLSETVEDVRSALIALLDALGVVREAPNVPARWAAQTDWQLAEVALSELAQGETRAWGGADPALEATLRREATRLRERLAQARILLAGGHPGERATPDTLAPGSALAPLRRLLTLRSLSPLHGALRALAARLRDPDLVIGVFGRVSTGKSSLINSVLGEDLLPSGAAPVTRRMLHLRHGTQAVRIVPTAGKVSETRPWSERAQWIACTGTEGSHCELVTPAVPRGTAWLDTPGLGATEPALGAAAPRAVWECDVVILCLGAGSLPGLDERAIVARAHAQSIPVHIVLTQADRLRQTERQQVLDWLETNFEDVTSIGAVSTMDIPGLKHLRRILAPLIEAPEHERSVFRGTRLHAMLDAAERMLTGISEEPASDEVRHIVESTRAASESILSHAPLERENANPDT